MKCFSKRQSVNKAQDKALPKYGYYPFGNQVKRIVLPFLVTKNLKAPNPSEFRGNTRAVFTSLRVKRILKFSVSYVLGL